MKVAVIGAGNIGTRHLQAIAKCDEDIELYAVEPVLEAAERSQEMVLNMPERRVQSIHYCDNIEKLPLAVDAAVIATGSLARRKVTEQLLAHASVKYLILEKVLFPCIEDYHAVGQLLVEKGVTAWVNCVRRSWPYMQTLKDRIGGKTPVTMSVEGNMWGIACNTIHYLDTLAWFTECDAPIEFDIGGLDDDVIDSKRSGYVEFTGELRAKMGENRLILRSHTGTFDGFTIDITTPDHRYQIKEQGRDGRNEITDTANGERRVESYEVPYQSELTNGVMSEILRTGNCPLVRYEQSAVMHIPMIKAFLRKLGRSETDVCNIT